MNQTLKGLRILNTRPEKQAQELSQQITAAGGVAIACPTLEIKATPDNWVKLLPDLNHIHHAIFISANAVYHCFKQLELQNINWPPRIKTIAIGRASEKALKTLNIQVNAIPDVPDSEHLLSLDTLQQIKNQSVLLFKGEGGRELIEQGLLLRGANVITLNVYKREMPQISHQFINSIWRDNLVDIILLTSEQSIHNLFKMFHKEAHYWLQEKPCLVISERLAKSASSFGMKKIIISHPDRMMNTLLDYYQGSVHGQ